MKRTVLAELKRLGIAADGSRLPKSLEVLPIFQQIGRLSSLVKVPGLHQALVTPELIDGVALLAGKRPSAIQETQLLLSPPHHAAWSLKRLNWHVDVAARDHLPGIQAFFLLDDVAPHGGATLALAGSHRTDKSERDPIHSLREILKTSADPERDLRSHDAAIIEMSGSAGDVYLMDMRLLHTPSLNAMKNVRMMATARCFLGP